MSSAFARSLRFCTIISLVMLVSAVRILSFSCCIFDCIFRNAGSSWLSQYCQVESPSMVRLKKAWLATSAISPLPSRVLTSSPCSSMTALSSCSILLSVARPVAVAVRLMTMARTYETSASLLLLASTSTMRARSMLNPSRVTSSITHAGSSSHSDPSSSSAEPLTSGSTACMRTRPALSRSTRMVCALALVKNPFLFLTIDRLEMSGAGSGAAPKKVPKKAPKLIAAGSSFFSSPSSSSSASVCQATALSRKVSQLPPWSILVTWWPRFLSSTSMSVAMFSRKRTQSASSISVPR
mmetsp:Transcript_15091/g.32440  ORF Transcript_15091/g.32440 Transcript_15091/m.32440 type:complete len:296 (+) Transcript_15091:387-1274(+)